jgi:hypothetical protein
MKSQNQIANVLPFRVQTLKIPAAAFERIRDDLRFASSLLCIDAPLEWEDRVAAERAICKALSILSDIRKGGEKI